METFIYYFGAVAFVANCARVMFALIDFIEGGEKR
jgi:hypothetical protein